MARSCNSGRVTLWLRIIILTSLRQKVAVTISDIVVINTSTKEAKLVLRATSTSKVGFQNESSKVKWSQQGFAEALIMYSKVPNKRYSYERIDGNELIYSIKKQKLIHKFTPVLAQRLHQTNNSICIKARKLLSQFRT